MLEWLRLIKATVNTSNSTLAIGGPVRPFDGTSSAGTPASPAAGGAATSPPVSPRALSTNQPKSFALSPVDALALAIVQLRSPESMPADQINGLFDGVMMSEAACNSLCGMELHILSFSLLTRTN